MLSITFPSSAAWSDGIRPAIDKVAREELWEEALETVAEQLETVAPDQVSTSTVAEGEGKKEKKENEKAKLVLIGAKFVLEQILQGAPPGIEAKEITEALTSATSALPSFATSSSSSSTAALSKDAAQVAANVWCRHAKKIIPFQRSRAIQEICHRAASDNSELYDHDANILRYLSAEVRICKRQESEQGKEENDNLFEPVANFAIANENCDRLNKNNSSNASGEDGVLLALNTKQTYDLMCEIDAIQRKLDSLRSG